MGRLGFSAAETADVLEEDREAVMAQFRAREGDIYRAYTQGRTEGMAEIRQTVMEAALNSSSPMLARMAEHYAKSARDNMEDMWG